MAESAKYMVLYLNVESGEVDSVFSANKVGEINKGALGPVDIDRTPAIAIGCGCIPHFSIEYNPKTCRYVKQLVGIAGYALSSVKLVPIEKKGAFRLLGVCPKTFKKGEAPSKQRSTYLNLSDTPIERKRSIGVSALSVRQSGERTIRTI